MKLAAEHTPVYDLGTSARFAKEMALVRDLFDPQQYFAGGFAPDHTLADACDFHCDVQDLTGLAEGAAGCILSMQVLEHVEEPLRAMREFHRALRPSGIAIIAVPFLTSYHGKRPIPQNPLYERGKILNGDNSHGGYGDYRRYTHEGLTQLAVRAGFTRVEMWPTDGPLICRLELLGLYRHVIRIAPLRWLAARLDRPRLGRATTCHFMLVQK